VDRDLAALLDAGVVAHDRAAALALGRLMIRVAAGEKLPLTQDDVTLDGWAVESRVYAEEVVVDRDLAALLDAGVVAHDRAAALALGRGPVGGASS
jgi:hypothetical protein